MRGLLLAALLGGCGCALELGTEVACGDGYVDPLSEEECDPAVPASYIAACRDIGIDRPGACDPVSCQFDLDACFPRCGNGVLEPAFGEECDPDIGDLVAEGAGAPCVELNNPGPLEYAGGFATRCLPDCTYDRTDCHFCGDGVRQDEPFFERCDQLDLVTQERAAFCFQQCQADRLDPVPSKVSCDASCAADCGGFSLPSAGAGCCLPGGELVSQEIACCEGPQLADPSRCDWPLAGQGG